MSVNNSIKTDNEILNTPAKQRGFKNWLLQVDAWAESHSISRKQALSIICLDSSKNGIKENTLTDLLSYCHSFDYIEHTLTGCDLVE